MATPGITRSIFGWGDFFKEHAQGMVAEARLEGWFLHF
jgi:hypothetical protein